MARIDPYLRRFEALHPKRIDLSLGRIERLLTKLGNPERHLPPVIHVAGTNGKGSTIAFMRAILEASGARVHVYTSPHLIRFNERIRLAGKLVSDDALVEAFERVEATNAGDEITFFEITTVVAFALFSQVPAEFLLLEVGLGGRLDTTNVIAAPLASVITPVSFDHREHLGETLSAIAGEKAGIIKRGCPVISGEQPEEARRVIDRIALRMRAPLLAANEAFHAHEEGGRMLYVEDAALMDLPLPRLPGRHQIANAALAIACLRAIAPEYAEIQAIETGFRQVEWPGRFQRLTGALVKLAPENAEIWLDGAHNAEGARVLAEAIGTLEERMPRPLILLCGAMQRKDIGEILTPFSGMAQELYAVPIENDQARNPVELAEAARKAGLHAAYAGSIEESLRFLAARVWPVPPRIVIMGSLYLAGEVLSLDGTIPH